jgi:NAD(P)H-dependent FMN reductase
MRVASHHTRMSKSPDVVAICGSLRDESTTRASLRHALGAASRAGGDPELLDLRYVDLPVFDADRRDRGDGPELRDRVARADGVILGTPVYHGTVASPLKNALDYCGRDEFEDTTVGLLATAGGPFPAGARAHLREVGRYLRATVLSHPVAIPEAYQAVSDGDLVDDDLAERTADLGRQVARYAGLHEYAHDGYREAEPPTP